ncbi:Transmembrane receptor eukaryota protein [Rutstroemia sp. NJR-2017a BBW]|nr:Transmembrane receptor eukaryota protein [Rutstroemia sp. NJR-2017a BBW]
MYDRKTWGGPIDPHILIKWLPTKQDTPAEVDPIASMVIFEWRDYDLVGVLPTADSIQKEFICDPENISNGFCNANQTGQFILTPNATEVSHSQLFTTAIHLNNTGPPINYPIKNTGYYCVGTTGYSPTDVKYTAVVEFRNAYGELPAAQIPKLPFYGIITIVYAVMGILWAFLYVQHRDDIRK